MAREVARNRQILELASGNDVFGSNLVSSLQKSRHVLNSHPILARFDRTCRWSRKPCGQFAESTQLLSVGSRSSRGRQRAFHPAVHFSGLVWRAAFANISSTIMRSAFAKSTPSSTEGSIQSGRNCENSFAGKTNVTKPYRLCTNTRRLTILDLRAALKQLK